MMTWETALADNSLIAMLMRFKPESAIEGVDVLEKAGFRIMEVPLNSPEPLLLINSIAAKFADKVVIDAGTYSPNKMFSMFSMFLKQAVSLSSHETQARKLELQRR